jgi:NAD(P)-dependent dehydrogenase (short-subunit alcohol dehydrogenase family)
LVYDPGYTLSVAVETFTIEDLRRQFEINVFGLPQMCLLVLPRMRTRGRKCAGRFGRPRENVATGPAAVWSR